MFHSECQPMTKPNIKTYVKLPFFKVGSIIDYYYKQEKPKSQVVQISIQVLLVSKII